MLLEEIQNKIDEIEKFIEFKKNILEYHVCTNCLQVFKLSENHPEACRFHPGKLYLGTFQCFGFTPQSNQHLDYYCRTSYHVMDKFKSLVQIEKYLKIFGDS